MVLSPRCGSKFIGGVEVPIKAKVLKAPNGRQYYISAMGEKKTLVRYIDNGEMGVLTNL